MGLTDTLSFLEGIHSVTLGFHTKSDRKGCVKLQKLSGANLIILMPERCGGRGFQTLRLEHRSITYSTPETGVHIFDQQLMFVCYLVFSFLKRIQVFHLPN